MPKIFELFGYPITLHSVETEKVRKNALCPFMGGKCDGGGNRELSNVNLSSLPLLHNYFEGQSIVASGICSIQLKENESPWIVCPRRLLVLGREKAIARAHQKQTEDEVINLLCYPSGTTLGVWSEVKFIYKEKTKSFNYAFDYILMPLGRISEEEISYANKVEKKAIHRICEKSGYALSKRNGEDYIENFPIGIPSIVEIMTCSTSGGNKRKRTTIPFAFEDAILEREHNAPSINKRQIWARMVSQLIVKSEVALGWGGKAIWIVQDTLADYISKSTALDLNKFLSDRLSEVNLLSFTYGNKFHNPKHVIELSESVLYAGPISSGENKKPSFQDMIRTPVKPTIIRLQILLSKRTPINQITIP